MRVRLQQSGLVVQLRAPLGDDELGTYAQERLRSHYAAPDHVLDEGAAYFQSFTGESATDSQVELYEQLRRRRPDLRLYWGIADWSCAVPDGAIPVLIRSRAWYGLLAEARCLIINIELERWFRSRDDQIVVQTFHGYPSKTMGIGLWQAKQFTERRIAAELSRTSEKWDVILTPAPEMDRHYREQYRYHGAIINEGYPRDDPLKGSRAPSVRAATRQRLGIRADQTAVLYAPTWRDDRATAPRAAAMVDHLDLEAAADALGDGYVLLVRGHRFHAKVPARRGRTARVVDVTDHPEINDLMLASDAAVLDYSSLRFDYAQTGKPMIFLVPDLDVYTRGVRGFLFDFAGSAPGPCVDTTAHVVEALLDLRALSERHSDQYRRFNETYNYRQDGHVAERVADALLDTWLG